MWKLGGGGYNDRHEAAKDCKSYEAQILHYFGIAIYAS